MKSKEGSLANRGFLEKGIETDYHALSLAGKIKMLKSKVAIERTLAARLLSKETVLVSENLIQALKIEKKLYPKIEICNALVAHSKSSVKLLIAELGEIGVNQHNSIPDKEFRKDSYPLPRDIAGRTLINIGKSALAELLKVLGNNNEIKISEAIDAIGYICFYDYQPQVFEKLRECHRNNFNNDLISWKIIRAMSGFSESKTFLLEQMDVCSNERIQKEIKRSLRLIEKLRK